MKGKLIVIEGACDGIGKTTQFELLKKRLGNDYSIVSHHFPTYNTDQGLLVENYLKGKYGNISDVSPYFVNSLYAVDRAVTWITELKKVYESGGIVLLDRYTTSSLIYQTAMIDDLDERKKFIDYVVDFEYEKMGIQKPDNVIFLYASFDLVTDMRKNRTDNDGVQNDIHEKDIDFMRKVYDNAMFVADYLGWNMIKCDIDDKMRAIEDIHEEIYNLIK
ncbi:MAG: deoxynucleoside kinase [Bacilli bacterium]|nr:deoxynucleoside kinase [Bacilli bacterium]